MNGWKISMPLLFQGFWAITVVSGRFFFFRLLMPTMMILDPGLHQHFYHFSVEHCDVHFRGEGVLDNTGVLWRVHGSWLVMSGKSEWIMMIFSAGTCRDY